MPKVKKIRTVKLSRIEQAIFCLAGFMEMPDHDSYQVKNAILDILGYEPITPIKN